MATRAREIATEVREPGNDAGGRFEATGSPFDDVVSGDVTLSGIGCEGGLHSLDVHAERKNICVGL